MKVRRYFKESCVSLDKNILLLMIIWKEANLTFISMLRGPQWT